ncbi:MAG: BTAD domain-containing putative transcriptional regulator [Gemmatimonadales bacterium]
MRLRTFGGLWIEAPDGSRLPNPGPRRLALLAIVAAAGRRGVSRDRVRAILWPDADEVSSRQALRQTIYALHHDLGVRPIEAGSDLRVDPDVLATDTNDVQAALARSDWETVGLLYRGPFAAGLSLADSPDFDRWLEGERTRFARQAESAFEAMVREAEAAGDRRRASEAWRRLTELDPLSGRYAASYIGALASHGDRSAALDHARRYSAEVRRELDADPDPLVVRLVAELRAAASASAAPSAGLAETQVTSQADVPKPETSIPSRRVRRRVLVGSALVAAIAVAAVAALRSARSGEERVVIAVGVFRDLVTADSVRWSGISSDALTTSLARLTGVEVIANSRILQLLDPGSDTLPAARAEAARRAGATEVVEGELVPAAGGRWRLDLRRVAVRRGAVRGAYSVDGTDRLDLIDSATTLLASDLRLERPRRPLAGMTSQSGAAQSLYQEGLRAYHGGEVEAAIPLFRAALEADSSFAMAAYYAYRASRLFSFREPALEARALALSVAASDRDRLIIQSDVRRHQNDTLALVFADSLAARFPRDPEALILAAEVWSHAKLIGPWERELYERAIAIDSAAEGRARDPCRVCTDFFLLVDALRYADSGAAAETVARRWLAVRPDDANAHGVLAWLLFADGRYEEGIVVLAGLETGAAGPGGPGATFVGRLLAGRLDEADPECLVHLDQDDPRAVPRTRWLCAILWRNQGRYRDATALVLDSRLPGGRRLRWRPSPDPAGEYVLALETGRPAVAMRALEASVPRSTDGLPPGQLARELTWSLTRRATAAVAAGQLGLAGRLADSAEAIGPVSLFGRDRLLHFFSRGLVAQAAGDHLTAVDLFRRSVFSWTFGYTRANYELARSLLALERPREAIAPLRAALRGGWDGGNLYVTRTELHELLAQAFVALGDRDSAASHYAVVERSWRGADPPLAARYRAARDFVVGRG